MPYQVNLRSSNEYSQSIDTLANSIADLTSAQQITLDVLLPGNTAMKVYMNTSDLYLQAFEVNGTKLSFKDTFSGKESATNVNLHFGGSHGNDLGTFSESYDAFTPKHLIGWLTGGKEHQKKSAIGFLIVAISEALRFYAVEKGIAEMLNGGTYSPSTHQTKIDTWKKESKNLGGGIRMLHTAAFSGAVNPALRTA